MLIELSIIFVSLKIFIHSPLCQQIKETQNLKKKRLDSAKNIVTLC